jgi:hypothetical protein
MSDSPNLADVSTSELEQFAKRLRASARNGPASEGRVAGGAKLSAEDAELLGTIEDELQDRQRGGRSPFRIA